MFFRESCVDAFLELRSLFVETGGTFLCLSSAMETVMYNEIKTFEVKHIFDIFIHVSLVFFKDFAGETCLGFRCTFAWQFRENQSSSDLI